MQATLADACTEVAVDGILTGKIEESLMEQVPPPTRGPGDTEEQGRLLRLLDRLADRWSRDRRLRISVGVSVTVVALSLSVGLLIAAFWLDLGEENLKGFGYAGIFLVNLFSTSTFFIPVPGLTAAGQALIISQARPLGPVWVGVLGGAGMALGEITAYVAGALGREFAHGKQMGGPKWFRTSVERIARAIDRLLARYGMLTLFTLSAIPNPFFEVAGLMAGAVRMPFWRFFSSVFAGKVTRGLILAFIGYYSWHVLGF